MQQAVNKYKDDPDVAFLFIHTWETSKTPVADATKYLTDNNYSFDVYFDLKDDKGSNPAVTQFGVKGIPAKFIIDPEGSIRFRGSGFGGGDDELVAELSAMLDLLKKL
jgi:hypothetical protein